MPIKRHHHFSVGHPYSRRGFFYQHKLQVVEEKLGERRPREDGGRESGGTAGCSHAVGVSRSICSLRRPVTLLAASDSFFALSTDDGVDTVALRRWVQLSKALGRSVGPPPAPTPTAAKDSARIASALPRGRGISSATRARAGERGLFAATSAATELSIL